MKEGVTNTLVGITSIGALLGLLVLLLLFGELDAVVRPRYVITINTDHAAGLRRGSAIELNGVPIGVIDEVSVRPGTASPVHIVGLIDRQIMVPRLAVPYATTSLLGGAAVLEMEAADPGGASDTLPRDGTAVIDAPIRFRMIEQITEELDARMEPLMLALGRFDELSETYLEFGRNLNELFGPQNDEAVAQGAAPNLRTTLARLYTVLDDMQGALTLAREWLGDDQLKADAKAAVTKASTLIDQATETMTRFNQLAGSIEEDADELVQRLVPISDQIALTLEQVRRVARLAAEGDGTIALLLNNPDLYRSLNDAAERLEQAVLEAQLLIEKIKAEGLPVKL